MSGWRVAVVEDDRVVAGLHCRFLSRVSGFEVVGVAGTAAEAEQLVGTLRPDLMLLDLGLPDSSGVTLLRRLRAQGNPLEVIAVTAATATPVVRATVHLGVVDYLVKPFDQERLRQALALFRRRVTMLAGDELAQTDVDRIYSDGPNAQRWLPRDLSRDRLRRVQASLTAFAHPVTAAEVAAHTGVSRVTARRYLEYLVTVGQAQASVRPSGPGRPTKTYLPTASPAAAG